MTALHLLDKYDFQFFAVAFYGLCCLMLTRFAEGFALFGAALLLWLVLIIPAAAICGAVKGALSSLFGALIKPGH